MEIEGLTEEDKTFLLAIKAMIEKKNKRIAELEEFKRKTEEFMLNAIEQMKGE